MYHRFNLRIHIKPVFRYWTYRSELNVAYLIVTCSLRYSWSGRLFVYIYLENHMFLKNIGPYFFEFENVLWNYERPGLVNTQHKIVVNDRFQLFRICIVFFICVHWKLVVLYWYTTMVCKILIKYIIWLHKIFTEKLWNFICSSFRSHSTAVPHSFLVPSHNWNYSAFIFTICS